MKYFFFYFCNTPNWDVQSEGHRVMAHQFEGNIQKTQLFLENYEHFTILTCVEDLLEKYQYISYNNLQE